MAHRWSMAWLFLAGALGACGGAGSGTDGGSGGGAGGGGGSSVNVTGAITVTELGESFVYQGGVLGCGPPFTVLLQGTVDTMTAASLEVQADGGVKFTSGILPAGTYLGGGASNTVTTTVLSGPTRVHCEGQVTLNNVSVASYSTVFTLNGSLDVDVTSVP